VVCTDREPVLAVRQLLGVPVALVLPGEPPPGFGGEGSSVSPPPGEEQNPSWRLDPAHSAGTRLCRFHVGRNCLAVPAACCDDRPLIADRLAALDESFDLAEPFARIREAIEEARRGG